MYSESKQWVAGRFAPRRRLVKRITIKTRSLLEDTNNKLNELRDQGVDVRKDIEMFRDTRKKEHTDHLDKIGKLVDTEGLHGRSREWIDIRSKNSGKGKGHYRTRRDQLVKQFEKVEKHVNDMEKKIIARGSREEKDIRREIEKVEKEFDKLQEFIGMLARYQKNPNAQPVDSLIDKIDDIIKIHKRESRFDSRKTHMVNRLEKYEKKWENYVKMRDDLLNELNLSP